LALDTGGSFTVALLSPFVVQHPEVHTSNEAKVSGLGLTGPETMIQSKLNAVRVGRFVIHNSIVELEPPKESDLPSKADGLLGANFFSKFTVTFDYGTNCMFLRPNRYYREPLHR